jgi:hypothetical protein
MSYAKSFIASSIDTRKLMDGVTSRYTSFGVDDLWNNVQASALFNYVLRLGNQTIRVVPCERHA